MDLLCYTPTSLRHGTAFRAIVEFYAQKARLGIRINTYSSMRGNLSGDPSGRKCEPAKARMPRSKPITWFSQGRRLAQGVGVEKSDQNSDLFMSRIREPPQSLTVVGKLERLHFRIWAKQDRSWCGENPTLSWSCQTWQVSRRWNNA